MTWSNRHCTRAWTAPFAAALVDKLELVGVKLSIALNVPQAHWQAARPLLVLSPQQQAWLRLFSSTYEPNLTAAPDF